MITLFEQELRQMDRHSSKGNQLKWEKDGNWYKADYIGYEGLAEFVTAKLLTYSDLKEEEYLCYELEEIRYKEQIFLGAKSKNMLHADWQIITLERLFKNQYNQSLYTAIWRIRDVKERLRFLVEQTEQITGMTGFGPYMTKLLTIDAFFKNEDRHTHNIAILMNAEGEYALCPMFDHGASLLADTRMDYPLTEDVLKLMDQVHAKTISMDFDEQLDAAEELYGRQIRFHFTQADVDQILQEADLYSEQKRERVKTILYQQMRKYAYLFVEKPGV